MWKKNLELVPHVPGHLVALLKSDNAYEKASKLRIAEGIREMLLQASAEFLQAIRETVAPDPWRFGFAVVLPAEKKVVGMCGFAAPPDSNGTVEIAYGIAPMYQGKGYATEAARALIEFARQHSDVRKICAHTLPEKNVSTRILEKCGFEKIGDATDPEGYAVWRWERNPALAVPNRASRS